MYNMDMLDGSRGHWPASKYLHVQTERWMDR